MIKTLLGIYFLFSVFNIYSQNLCEKEFPSNLKEACEGQSDSQNPSLRFVYHGNAQLGDTPTYPITTWNEDPNNGICMIYQCPDGIPLGDNLLCGKPKPDIYLGCNSIVNTVAYMIDTKSWYDPSLPNDPDNQELPKAYHCGTGQLIDPSEIVFDTGTSALMICDETGVYPQMMDISFVDPSISESECAEGDRNYASDGTGQTPPIKIHVDKDMHLKSEDSVNFYSETYPKLDSNGNPIPGSFSRNVFEYDLNGNIISVTTYSDASDMSSGTLINCRINENGPFNVCIDNEGNSEIVSHWIGTETTLTPKDNCNQFQDFISNDIDGDGNYLFETAATSLAITFLMDNLPEGAAQNFCIDEQDEIITHCFAFFAHSTSSDPEAFQEYFEEKFKIFQRNLSANSQMKRKLSMCQVFNPSNNEQPTLFAQRIIDPVTGENHFENFFQYFKNYLKQQGCVNLQQFSQCATNPRFCLGKLDPLPNTSNRISGGGTEDSSVKIIDDSINSSILILDDNQSVKDEDSSSLNHCSVDQIIEGSTCK